VDFYCLRVSVLFCGWPYIIANEYQYAPSGKAAQPTK
jgi:hypothetical protein